MPFLFVSYRRDDAQGYAGRVYDWLAVRFGPESVFKDVDSIRAGEDFSTVIEATIARCDAVLAVIGPRWLEGERLNDPDDWVRLELSKGLELGIRVVPVLVQGAAMPPAESLPPDLKPLANRHALELTDATWTAQLERLLDDLGLRSRARHLHRPAVWLATLSTVVALATGMFIWRDQAVSPERGTAAAERGSAAAERGSAAAERGSAAADSGYQHELAEICDSRNAADTQRAKDTRRMRSRLKRARNNVAQRDALLDVQRRIQASSNYDLARLRALDVPAAMSVSQRSAVSAWARNNERTQAYIQGLAAAGTRAQLLAAIDSLARVRPAIARDGVTLTSQLIRLGAGRCRIEPPKVTTTVTLPGLPRRHKHSRPSRTPTATPPPIVTSTPRPPAVGQGGTPVPSHPPVNPPASQTSPPVNPPAAGGGGGGSGGGGSGGGEG